MRFFIIVFLPVLMAQLSNDDIRLSNLLQKNGVPICFLDCVSDLIDSLQQQLDTDNVLFEHLCREYESAKICIELPCPRLFSDIFAILTNGIQFMCVEKREEFTNLVVPCIEKLGKEVNSECEKQCNFRPALQKLIPMESNTQLSATKKPTAGFNLLLLLRKFGNLCTAIRCSLHCSGVNYSRRCSPVVGFLIVEASLRPFHRISNIIDLLPDQIRALILGSVPKSCDFLVNIDKLIVFGADERKLIAREKGQVNNQLKEKINKRWEHKKMVQSGAFGSKIHSILCFFGCTLFFLLF